MSDFTTCLCELGCEELPPKALKKLIAAFQKNVETQLSALNLSFHMIEPFATPRRLALLIHALQTRQADQVIARRGPSYQAAFDADSKPTKAALGFARSCGVAIDALSVTEIAGGKYLQFEGTTPGKSIDEWLPSVIEQALAALPIPKRMRWGSNTFEFVRPVHWLVLMKNSEVIPATILGCKASNQTYGHRFHAPEGITLLHASDYCRVLEETGGVIVDFSTRRKQIASQMETLANAAALTPVVSDALLDEVTSMVEWPTVLRCSFDEGFLSVPEEALISSMQQHQKCFALRDNTGNLSNHFLTVSNIAPEDTAAIVTGNERVMRARLSDAQFFYETDKKIPLENWHEKLAHVTFQKQLGSLKDKTDRVAKLAVTLAPALRVDKAKAERAAKLSKVDLLSSMVGEFPECQGIMGRYYAIHAGEASDVAEAIAEHYLPRFARDRLPETALGTLIALADKLDTLVGIFGIGNAPTGDKDPFALRRQTIGVIRICLEGALPFHLSELLRLAAAQYGERLTATNTTETVHAFVLDRLKYYCLDNGIRSDALSAALAVETEHLSDIVARAQATQTFANLPEAQQLTQANKRVVNLLSKADAADCTDPLDSTLFTAPEATQLAEAVAKAASNLEPRFRAGNLTEASYTEILTSLATLQAPVDVFFDKVLINCEDARVRRQHLALLRELRSLFLQVADVSFLS